MRLLFVIKSLGIRGGGAERVLCDLCSELADRGHSVTVASFDQVGSADFYELSPRVERLRLALGRTEAPTRPLEFIRRARRLRSVLGELAPDVAVGFMHSAFVPLALAAKRVAVPVVASEHIAYCHYDERLVQKLLVRAAAPLCAAFTAPLEDVRLQFPSAIAGKMRVIANPVTVRPRRRTRARGRRRLLFVGNFRPQKDHRTLIDAFAKLALVHPEWDLRLVGAGELRSGVEAQVQGLGLQRRVSFAGAVKEISAEYAAADLFVVPSTYESFGLATAEALASGIPVVGFADCPGTRELVENGCNGLLVEGPDRVQALADGLERLMKSSEFRRKLGRAAPRSVSNYSIASIADAWEDLLWTQMRAELRKALPSNRADRDVRRNVAVHNRLARKYERIHGEIFNPIEQARLRSFLERALAEVRTGHRPIQALDMGCGTGNLTRHLLDLGAEVTAADVASGFLELVRSCHPKSALKTHLLNGRDLGGLRDESFDLVAAYSVLHHIPDYVAACAEMARVCRKGGVVVIDHEASPNVWQDDSVLRQFREEAWRFDWRKYARPANYLHRARRFLDARYSNEGDIHVWPDDHIDWSKIVDVMRRSGFESVGQDDYLLYRKVDRPDVYRRFAGRCADTRAMIFRRGEQ